MPPRNLAVTELVRRSGVPIYWCLDHEHGFNTDEAAVAWEEWHEIFQWVAEETDWSRVLSDATVICMSKNHSHQTFEFDHRETCGESIQAALLKREH